MRRRVTFSLAVLAALLATPAAAAPHAGSGSLGDPLFSHMGNGGYNVSHYGVALRYAPSSGRLRATAVIRARSTEALRSFQLDYRGPAVRRVRVNGRRAAYRRKRSKLVIRPAAALPGDKPFEVIVGYAGRPRRVVDVDGSSEGWIRTDDGAVAFGEPQGTPSWLPCNDDPQDKATMTTRLTVARSMSAISNGRLVSVRRHGRLKSLTWRESQPMATYLATVSIGRGQIVRGRAVGVPTYTLVDPRERVASRVVRHLPGVLRFLQSIYGPYPFDSAGNIVEHGAGVGYALETQTRPTYDGAPNFTTMVHEQAHQWFGDSVTLRDWPDIWLHEGFATWTEWYYAERHGGDSAATVFRRGYAEPASNEAIWAPPPGNPGSVAKLFAPSVYVRGAMAIQALRETIGDEPFFRLLRSWQATRRHGNGTIRQFISLAEDTSSRQLDDFFKRWLYSPGKPPGGPLGSGT